MTGLNQPALFACLWDPGSRDPSQRGGFSLHLKFLELLWHTWLVVSTAVLLMCTEGCESKNKTQNSIPNPKTPPRAPESCSRAQGLCQARAGSGSQHSLSSARAGAALPPVPQTLQLLLLHRAGACKTRQSIEMIIPSKSAFALWGDGNHLVCCSGSLRPVRVCSSWGI